MSWRSSCRDGHVMMLMSWYCSCHDAVHIMVLLMSWRCSCHDALRVMTSFITWLCRPTCRETSHIMSSDAMTRLMLWHQSCHTTIHVTTPHVLPCFLLMSSGRSCEVSYPVIAHCMLLGMSRGPLMSGHLSCHLSCHPSWSHDPAHVITHRKLTKGNNKQLGVWSFF